MTQLSQALDGRCLWVTAQRRSDELAEGLRRHGAEVIVAPVLGVEQTRDSELLRRTRQVIDQGADTVVVTTGAGFRDWCDAAAEVGLLDDLVATLGRARIVARGAKPRGALQARGLSPEYVAESETSAELGAHLVGRGVAGERVVVQHHASGDAHLEDVLTGVGAEVVPVQVHRWAPAPDPDAVRRTAHACGEGRLDAVLFTSAPGAVAWLAVLDELGVREAVAGRVGQGTLLLAAVGPVTAEPLGLAGHAPVVPDRSRLGALVRLVVTRLQR